MTTHDRDKVIAAAKEACFSERQCIAMFYDYGPYEITAPRSQTISFYAIAFEAGRQAEREEIVRDLLPPIDSPQTKAHYIANEIAESLCKAIRARGNGK